MSMSRKHFEDLAKSLKMLKQDLDLIAGPIQPHDVQMAFEKHVRRVAALCRVDNPEFQFGRFYVAAGIPV